jgi:hypothetical protein
MMVEESTTQEKPMTTTVVVLSAVFVFYIVTCIRQFRRFSRDK